MGGRRQVRIAHAEIDHIGPSVPCRCLGLVDLLEALSRQTAAAVRIFPPSRPPAAAQARLLRRRRGVLSAGVRERYEELDLPISARWASQPQRQAAEPGDGPWLAGDLLAR